LLNVLSNAVKFTPDGSSVSWSASQSIDNLIVEFRDARPGIPKKKQKTHTNTFVRWKTAPY